MFMFNKCRSQNWDLDFWDSNDPKLTNCMKYWILDLLFPSIYCIIFLIDFLVNYSLIKKNTFKDYIYQYLFRFITNLILIISSILDFFNSINFTTDDNELFNLKLLTSTSRLCIYIMILIFDISHHSKNMGASALLALLISIDWFCNCFIILDIFYLYSYSYPLIELLIFITRFICLSILFASYFFLPNLPYLNEKYFNNKNEIDEKIDQNKFNTNYNIHKANGFSIKSRSLFSQIFFLYFEPFIYNGYRNKYNLRNIIPLEQELTVNSVLNDYEINYKNKYLKNSTNNDFKVIHFLLKLYRNFYIFNFTIYTIQVFLSQYNPQIVAKLINFIEKGTEYKWHAYVYILLLFICFLTKYVIVEIFNRNMHYIQAKVQILLVNSLYKKALKKSFLKDSEKFDTYNLMTIDVNNITVLLYFLGDFILLPISTFLSIYFIYKQIGAAVLYAFLVMPIIIVPTVYFLTKKSKIAQIATMKLKDKRLKFLSDLLNGIKQIKFNYWDSIFNHKLSNIRDEEMKHFKTYQLLFTISQSIFHLLPVILSILSFTFYILLDDNNVLTPVQAFTSLSYFNLLGVSLFSIPRTIHFIIIFYVSSKRISRFLKSEEKDDYISNEFDEQNAIEIGEDVCFSWNQNSDKNDSESNEHTLKNINLKIKKGNLVALISDKTASGRTSFISCLLGEMKLIKNNKNDQQKINISNDMTIAFVPSTPWIEKKSIKENILFGLPFDQIKYDYVITQCLLKKELIKFKDGDHEIMNKDFDLEIKQLVSLARAYYSEANLILLDDFLNVFNDNSAKLIFDKIINPNEDSLFKNKTCIMVLNRLEYVKYFDQILKFNSGEITTVNKDQFENVIDNELSNNEDYNNNYETKNPIQQSIELFKRNISKIDNENIYLSEMIQNNDHDDKTCKNCIGKKLIDDESEGELNLSTYKLYFKTWKPIWLFILILSHILTIYFQIRAGNWIAYWSKHSDDRTGDELKKYNLDGLMKWVFLSLLNSVFLTLANLAAIYGEVGSAIRFHKILLTKILKLQLYFFGRTPVGSIITRFSRDIDSIDNNVAIFLRFSIYIGFQIICVFVIIIATYPLSSILVVISIIVYSILFKVFLSTLMVVKRLELQTRTVLYNRFEELNTGIQSILAYNKEEYFTEILNQNLESDVNCNFMIWISLNWLALRNEMLSIVFLIVAALFSIAVESVDAGKAGLVLNFSQALLGLIMAFIFLTVELHNNMISVDRISQYLNLEEENNSLDTRSLENWPKNGQIEFRNYSASYAECRNSVLENINLKINGGSSILLIGESNSGKSSFAYSLFNSLKTIDGTILIDDIDIQKISLKSLRQNLSIMDQDPALFTGPIRFNLDPEDKYSDDELWTVLEYVGLKETILEFKNGLFYELNESGGNLSLGQRQLLCLARTMLKKSKIMILDLVSCQFDLETKTRINKLLKTVLNDRTIILIVKKIDSTIDNQDNKIILLNNRQIVEFNGSEIV